MSIQLRIGLGAIAIAIGAHTWHTLQLRKKHIESNIQTSTIQSPTKRFSRGSADEVLSFTVKTGDLVLFQRDCLTYPLFSGLACAIRQQKFESLKNTRHRTLNADHTGIIIQIHGEPYIFETSTYGIRLIPFDTRILQSLSPRILIRPLKYPLTKEQVFAMENYAKSEVAKNSTSFLNPFYDLVNASEFYFGLTNVNNEASRKLVTKICGVVNLSPCFDISKTSSHYGTEIPVRELRLTSQTRTSL